MYIMCITVYALYTLIYNPQKTVLIIFHNLPSQQGSWVEVRLSP